MAVSKLCVSVSVSSDDGDIHDFTHWTLGGIKCRFVCVRVCVCVGVREIAADVTWARSQIGDQKGWVGIQLKSSLSSVFLNSDEYES